MLNRLLYVLIPSVQAEDWRPDRGFGGSMADLIRTVLNLLLTVAVITAVAFLIINGLQYITAGSDSGKAEKAQKGIQYAIIGLIVAFCAYVLVQFVMKQLGTEEAVQLESHIYNLMRQVT